MDDDDAADGIVLRSLQRRPPQRVPLQPEHGSAELEVESLSEAPEFESESPLWTLGGKGWG